MPKRKHLPERRKQMDRFISRLTRDTLALVLAGGRGSRLYGLTRWRAKPAVAFGGMMRIIDFPLSNCINSGIRRIQVLTQYKAHSLIRHVHYAWSSLRSDQGEYVDVVPAQQRIDEEWYAGTADAVYQNIDILRRQPAEYILILAGDHVYSMDYGPMLAAHSRLNADVTVGCIEVPRSVASRFGVVAVDRDGWIERFDEKPADPPAMPGRPDTSLASMGIYVFSKTFLFDALERDSEDPGSKRDFGHDIIPRAVRKARALHYAFRDAEGRPAYWRDVGTIDSYWEANMELVAVVPPLDLYYSDWKIWTAPRQLPPAKFVFDDDGRRGMAVDSMISPGCIVSGSEVSRSLLSTGAMVHSYCTIQDSVILPNVDIGRHCRIRRAVIDKRCRIPEGTVIGEDPEQDAERFFRTEDGIVLVTPDDLRPR